MKKVLFLLLSLNIGGLEKVVLEISRRIREKGFNTTIICLDGFGSLEEEYRKYSDKLILVKRKSHGIDYTIVHKLLAIFKKEKIDVVHSHNFTPIFYGSIAARLAGIPLVYGTQHNSRFFKEGKKRVLSLKYLSSLNSKIITVSNEIFSLCKIDLNIPNKRLQLIYNGVDTEKFTNKGKSVALLKEIGLSTEHFIIGQVCRLSPEKNLPCLLTAFEKFHRTYPQSKLLLVGDGPERNKLLELRNTLKLKNDIIFAGARKDVDLFLNLMDVFVMTSLTEGVSITLLEAMACSLPVIVTRVGGNVEIVQDGESGILIEPDNYNILTERLNQIFQAKNIMNNLGRSARYRVCSFFSLDKMVDQHISLYKI